MKNIKIYIILLFTMSFFACENNIDFKGEMPDALIVLNSVVVPDSIITVHLSKSKFFLADDSEFPVISNADISVYLNGIFKEKLAYVSSGIYKTTFAPSMGDSVSLNVDVSGFKSVDCGVKIPTQPTVLSLDTVIDNLYAYPATEYKTDNMGNFVKEDTIGWNLSFNMKVKLRIKDNPYKRNFYQLQPEVEMNSLVGENYGYYTNFINTTLDGILSNENGGDLNDMLDISSNYNYFTIFSDELFNGKEFLLSCTVNGNIFVPFEKLETGYLFVNLKELNADYYNYLDTRSLQMSGDGFFSEPVQIFSNVNNGIGILGAYNNSNNITKIKLSDLLENATKSYPGYYGY